MSVRTAGGGEGMVIAPLENRSLRLAPITGPDDLRALFLLAVSRENLVRWKYRGTTPSFEQFLTQVWQGVLCQFVIRQRDDGQGHGADDQDAGDVLGLVTAYNADHRSKTCWLSVMTAESCPRGFGVSAAILFLEYVFTAFDFRWAYFEALEFNFEQFGSGEGRLFETVARLPEHEFHGGRYWDQIIGRVTRDRFYDLILPRYRRLDEPS